MYSVNFKITLLTLSLVLFGCTSFLIPKELTKQDLTEILSIIGNREPQKLVSVQYLSDSRPASITRMLGNKPITEFGDDYGVRLYFRRNSCSGGTGYIFVRQDGKWVEDGSWHSMSPRSCP